MLMGSHVYFIFLYKILSIISISGYQTIPIAFTGELSSLVVYVLFIRRARGHSCALMTSGEERSFINVRKSLLTVPYVDRQGGLFLFDRTRSQYSSFYFIFLSQIREKTS